jgi:hypothetical protein
MNKRAAGPFEVKLQPLDVSPLASGTGLGRMSLDKQFHGDLDAVSQGEMLSAMGSVKGSAAYVAIERVTGTLDGRKGTFFLQHRGTMTRGAPFLDIVVVPDSGTGELSGIDGKMNIDIAEGGKHSYTFDYSLPPDDARPR